MQDQFNRSIEYLRISITDRCNLCCSYCMPAAGVNWLPNKDILSYEEILRVVRLSVDLGIKKFRVTGGEPLVRKGILPFLKEVAAIPGVEDLTITTNGVLLAPLAVQLKASGVKRVNISLDTLDSAKFSKITRGGNLNDVLKGIEQSLEAGLNPVKLNMVVMRSFNDDEFTEGYKRANKPKIEVFRKGVYDELLCSPQELIAIATDVEFNLGVPCYGLDDASGLANRIEELFLTSGKDLGGNA